MSPRGRGLGLEMSKPLGQHGTERERGSEKGGAVVSTLLLYWRLHGPLIVCLSFRPDEHVMSPLERVCFFFLSASWQQGALTHLIWPCTAVWCQADCPASVCVCTAYVCLCMCANVHGEFRVFRATHFLEVNANANWVRRVLIPVWSVVQTKSLLKAVVSYLSPPATAIHGLLTIGLLLSCIVSLMYTVMIKVNNLFSNNTLSFTVAFYLLSCISATKCSCQLCASCRVTFEEPYK